MYECVAENGNGDPVSVEAELTVYDGEKLHVVSSKQSSLKPNTYSTFQKFKGLRYTIFHKVNWSEEMKNTYLAKKTLS